ncbi:MAG: F0F1 ATP synthase subunit A, partial [Treponemataceae bacterium]
MDLGERLMEALEFKTVFTLRIAGHELPITETVVVCWIVMGILIAGSLLLTRNLREVPKGSQLFLEAFIGFLNSFSKEHLGKHWMRFAPYIGTVFLFLATANLLPIFS